MSIANVTLNSTFDEWRTVTNQLSNYINDVNNNSLLVLGPSLANTARDHANLSFSQANTARDQANAAFLAANSGIGIDVVFGQANTARIHANVSFEQANTARDHANAAFAAANAASGGAAIEAFGQANTARTQANDAYTRANSSVTVIQNDDANTTRYVIFTDKTTGELANSNVATSLSYNPSSGALAATSVKSSAYYDSNNRLLLIKDSSGTVVWGT